VTWQSSAGDWQFSSSWWVTVLTYRYRFSAQAVIDNRQLPLSLSRAKVSRASRLMFSFPHHALNIFNLRAASIFCTTSAILFVFYIIPVTLHRGFRARLSSVLLDQLCALLERAINKLHRDVVGGRIMRP
jgi:hypothetical protein